MGGRQRSHYHLPADILRAADAGAAGARPGRNLDSGAYPPDGRRAAYLRGIRTRYSFYCGQRLAELAAFTYFDCSRLRKQPRHIYYTFEGGTEVCLTNIGLLRQQLEEEPIPLESLVTGEPFSSLLGRFATEELERLEMEWDQGRLVLCHDGDMYACLYFENNFGRGNCWYALLADAEMYRTIDCNDVVYVPFGMWKLAEYSIFHSVQNFLQDMECLIRWAGDSSRTADRAGGSGAVR